MLNLLSRIIPRSLHWRIAVTYTGIIVVVMVLVSYFMSGYIKEIIRHQSAIQSEEQSRLIADLLAGSNLKELSLEENYEHRVVVLDYKDAVLLDTKTLNTADKDHSIGGVSFSEASIVRNGERYGKVRVYSYNENLENQVDSIVIRALLIGLVVPSVSVILGLYIARRTSRSIKVLTAGATKIESGDLTYRVRVSSHEETAELADAFNLMADTISEMVENISNDRDTISAVLNTMADGVISIDREGVITLINQTAAETFIISAADTVGMRISEVIRDHEILQLYSKCLQSSTLRRVEVEIPETRSFLSVTATPLGQESERGALLTIHDLTGLRQIETTRKEFVSNVSHELRSPISSIRAMVETLEDGAIDDKKVASDFIMRIQKEVERMTSMVDVLLELSRIESGQEVVNMAPLQLKLKVEEAIELVKRSESPVDLNITSEIQSDINVVAQSDKLLQILVNLLQNAIKFTSTDGSIIVRSRVSDKHVLIDVEDNGTGIASEHLPHVFERFYKADRSRRDGGSGLGLAIVKHLVQAHGGDVSVDSVEGEGSVFSFTLSLS